MVKKGQADTRSAVHFTSSLAKIAASLFQKNKRQNIFNTKARRTNYSRTSKRDFLITEVGKYEYSAKDL